MSTRRLWVAYWCALACWNVPPSRADEDSVEIQRAVLVEDLSAVLLSAHAPISLGPQLGWRTVVLAPPGTPLLPLAPSLQQPGDSVTNETALLEAVATYDRPLQVLDRVGHPSYETILEAWAEVLVETMPREALSREELPAEVQAILFRQPDAIDTARGVRWDREPSQTWRTYMEYEAICRLLPNAGTFDPGAWRLHPKLAKYPTIDVARHGLVEEWIRIGYKQEVESAKAMFERNSKVVAWREWSIANERFRADREYSTKLGWIPKTVMFPPPESWASMETWVKLRTESKNIGTALSAQIARVRLHRPWFALDSLADGRIRCPGDSSLPAKLTSGDEPTATSFPKGRLAVTIDELILIRNIVIEGAQRPKYHPLAAIEFPNATHLLGYVVRVLPPLRDQ